MELEWKEYKYKEKKISFTLKEKEINGITGNHLEDLVEIIRFNYGDNKNIFQGKKELSKDIIKDIKAKIAYIREELLLNTYHTIEEEMIEYIKEIEIYPKDLKKKLKDSLKIVGLEEEYLERQCYSLSSSEKELAAIAIELLKNPEIIILEEPLKRLDIKNRKKLMMVLRKIKDNFNKTIVIISMDPEVLYKETEHLIIYKNDKILIEGKTTDIYQRVDFLRRHKVEVPEIVEFTYLARKYKNAKIDYFKDVRDIIKDIYKHV